ncbi:hypothetical protein [Hubei permutotetra-like virus 9]|uniref:hypothetical protein n=1 Tax=Hubei permutotetra-like virus 9 TaxID=1923083 RepID=UPI00090C5069|nr:hypothetical protein [Hubei permutotetra-like virus 9]APG76976.1 hypothetical protein [Hubei permutotetra-like virus 9]
MVNSEGEYILEKFQHTPWNLHPTPHQVQGADGYSQYVGWRPSPSGPPTLFDAVSLSVGNSAGFADASLQNLDVEEPKVDFVFNLQPLDLLQPNIPSIVRLTFTLTFERMNIPAEENKYDWVFDLSDLLDHVEVLPTSSLVVNPHLRQFTKTFWGFTKRYARGYIPKVVVSMVSHFGVEAEDTFVGRIRGACEWMSTSLALFTGPVVREPARSFAYLWELNLLKKRHSRPLDPVDDSLEFVLLDAS